MAGEDNDSEVLAKILSAHGMEVGKYRIDHIEDRVQPGVVWVRIPPVQGLIDERRPDMYTRKAGSDIAVYPLWTEEQQGAADLDIFRQSGVAQIIHEKHECALLVMKDQYTAWTHLYLQDEQESIRVLAAIMETYRTPYSHSTPAIFLDPRKKMRKRRPPQMPNKSAPPAVDLDAIDTPDAFVCAIVNLWPPARCSATGFMQNWPTLVSRPKWLDVSRENDIMATTD